MIVTSGKVQKVQTSDVPDRAITARGAAVIGGVFPAPFRDIQACLTPW